MAMRSSSHDHKGWIKVNSLIKTLELIRKIENLIADDCWVTISATADTTTNALSITIYWRDGLRMRRLFTEQELLANRVEEETHILMFVEAANTEREKYMLARKLESDSQIKGV